MGVVFQLPSDRARNNAVRKRFPIPGAATFRSARFALAGDSAMAQLLGCLSGGGQVPGKQSGEGAHLRERTATERR
jgi:hypothetical protein